MKNIDFNNRCAFYALLYPRFRKTAADCGYALALHGSMNHDMDMIAVPWKEEVSPVDALVKAISDCMSETIYNNEYKIVRENKPQNRVAYSISIMGDWYIDLSIVRPIAEYVEPMKNTQV